jgi:hypothetical protein
MLALAKLRCVKAGGSGARCFAAFPFGLPVLLLSDWWEACATSAAVGGGALERQKKYQEDIFIF